MKRALLVIFLTFGVLMMHPKEILAYTVCTSPHQSNCCESTNTNSCPSPQGLCIGSTMLCCSDEATCMTTDINPSWIPPATPTPGPRQTPAATAVPSHCVNQTKGDCTNPTLPQACSIGMYYDCCNTERACRNLGGVPVPHANPSQPTTNPKSTPTTVPITCGTDNTGIRTAIGCIHALGSQELFLSDILRWAVGIGGGIAFLLMLYAGFMIMTAAGNPERLKAGQELLTSAISGLILLVFSVFILKFIGVDILGLNRFGFGK